MKKCNQDKIKNLLDDVFTKATKEFVKHGGDMRQVLRGDIKRLTSKFKK